MDRKKRDALRALAAEFGDADFGDARLTRRLMSIVERVGAAPAASFPAALPTEAELEAGYRFFNNDEVTLEGILAPHAAVTAARAATEAEVLVVSDSTKFVFSPHGAREGLGRVRKGGQAFFSHHSIAVLPGEEREVLGVLGISTWVRPTDGAAPIDERGCWWGHVEQVDRLGIGRDRVVHVMDREADIYELLAVMQAGGHRFVVRMKHDRTIVDGGERVKLRDVVGNGDVVASRVVDLSGRPAAGRSPKQKHAHPPRAARMAALAIVVQRVTLQRPNHAPKQLPTTLDINLVRVVEVGVPTGIEPVEWLLATSDDVATSADALRVVDRYRTRWVIEEYFQAIKTGCAFERRQLEDYDGLRNVLGTFAPIAARMLLLRSTARQHPDAPATRVFSRVELQVLRRAAAAARPLPARPTVTDALWSVAALGGHLKRNGAPGWQTLGRGMKKLLDLVEGWQLRDGAKM